MGARAAKRWFWLSVRARTTVAAALVVGLALLVAGVALAMVLERSLVNDIDQVAELRASALVEQANQGNLHPTIQADDDEAIQLVDSQGRVVAASSNVEGRPAFSSLRPQGTEPGKVTTDSIVGVPGRYRVLALPADSPSGPLVVYVATSLKHADATLVLQQRSLLVGVPLLIGLVVATTWISVGRALRPVDAIRTEVAEITQLDLDRRVPVPRANDEVSRLATTMNDMLDRLQASAERQRQFVADASHELRTPLAATRADLEVTLLHPEAGSWLVTARAALDETLRMQRLIEDLLYTARSDHRRGGPPMQRVDLRQVVYDELVRARRFGPVRIDSAGLADAEVIGHPDDLARVVRNLLDNATQHARSAVTVSLAAADGRCVLTVQDDGPGVPPEDRERIFERFTRLDGSRSRSFPGLGTGLALAIVKDVVEHHGGTVTVTEGTDRGARFAVTLSGA